jgi:hypothetical protein
MVKVLQSYIFIVKLVLTRHYYVIFYFFLLFGIYLNS